MASKTTTYVCDRCGEAFPVTPEDLERSAAEFAQMFPDAPAGAERETICDGCWQRMFTPAD